MKERVDFDPANEKHVDKLLGLYQEAVLEYFDFRLASWQLEISREIFYRVFLRKRYTITISACRQIGKTETICFCIWFLSDMFTLITGERFRVCFTAPEKGTSSEIYDRTKLLFDQCEAMYPKEFVFDQKNLDAMVMANGTRIETFGLFKTFAKREDKKTVREGRTFNVVIRDEMHVGNDEIFKDEIEPAMSTTGGLDIWIGNGGFRNCEAKKKVAAGKTDRATVFFYDFDVMRDRMNDEYEKTGNKLFERWLDSQNKYIEDEGGKSSELVRKNLYNEGIVEFGNFCTPTELHACRRFEDPERFTSNWCDVGIDFGKKVDLTIVTVTDYENNVRTWGAFRGDYTEQTPEIAAFLRRVKEEHRVVLKRCYFDSTGVGDVVGELLKKELWFPCKPVVFSPKTKDELGRKGLRSLRTSEDTEKLSYPADHKHAPFFETQMLDLEKEFRGESEKLNYKHPPRADAHDDFPDSYFLSIYGIQKIRKTRTFSERAKGLS